MSLIEKYINSIPSDAKGRRQSYKSNLKNYFRYLCPDQTYEKQFTKKQFRYIGVPLSKKQNDFIEKYFKTKRDYKKDVKKYVESLRGTPPKTIKSKVASIKSFLEYYDIELTSKEWKDIKQEIKGSRAVTIDKVPSKEELKKILTHATVKDKALFLTLISSGMRIGEATQITLDDIKELPLIHIRARYTKTSNPRVTFVSPEAKEALEKWLPIRQDYLRVAVKRLNCQKPSITGKRPERIIKKIDDNRVFPFNTSTARNMMQRLLRKSGLDERDPSSSYHTIHIHCLRKYFSSHLNISGCPSDVVEALLGHEEKLMRIYNLYTTQQIKDIYDKYSHAVCVFKDSIIEEQVNTLYSKLDQKDQEIQHLQKRLDEMNQTMLLLVAQKQVKK
jgi:integrase